MTNDERPSCRWAPNAGRRLLRTHERDCSGSCDGCKPCPERHCRCGRHLEEHDATCAKCVGKVRTMLKRIRDLCSLAPIVATEKGVDSPAAILAGPVPEHSTAQARHGWAMRGGLCRCHERGRICPDMEVLAGPSCAKTVCGHVSCERIHGRRICPDLVGWLEETSDQRHPLTVLGGWDIAVTEHLAHQERTLRITVDRAVEYLCANLTDLARDEDFGFDELAREVRDCLEHVENVMAVALRPQKGAPCPVCHNAGRKARPLVREFADDQPDDTLDIWACPSAVCGETWTIEEYDKYVQREHRGRAEALTARAMAAEYRVSEGSIRGWASLGNIRKRGKDHHGLTLYDVGDTLAMREKSTRKSA